MPYTCECCGYPDLTEPARSKAGGGSNEICYSCGFEPGYTDDALHISYEQWRAQWIARGMPWHSIGRKKPADWNPAKQLQNIGVNLLA